MVVRNGHTWKHNFNLVEILKSWSEPGRKCELSLSLFSSTFFFLPKIYLFI